MNKGKFSKPQNLFTKNVQLPSHWEQDNFLGSSPRREYAPVSLLLDIVLPCQYNKKREGIW